MYVEMLKAQEEKKLAKKLKKEKKALKKEKKAKKSKKQKWRDSDAEKSEEEPLDSDEELFRFFEEPEPPTKEAKKSSKNDLVPRSCPEALLEPKFDQKWAQLAPKMHQQLSQQCTPKCI